MTLALSFKIAPKSRFLLRWNNSPPFARSPNTLIFRFTQKSIKNESTTANTNVIIFLMLIK